MGCGPSKGKQSSSDDGREKLSKKGGVGDVPGKGTGGQDGVSWALLSGDIDQPCPPSDKIVRIFLSSTFTDTLHERNQLMKDKFPALRKLCQGLGYQFQVVDMRWGVTDEATDDHSTMDLCLKEIERCKQISTGPCFVTFVSHKYGYRGMPRSIDTVEFEQMCGAVSSEDDKNLLQIWFKKDENARPAVYILQPISSQFPDFLSEENEKRLQARQDWYKTNDAMFTILSKAAETVRSLHQDRAREIKQSVTEAEIRRGLLLSPTDGSLLERGLWFYRHIEGLENAPVDDISVKYKDCKGSQEQIEESRRMLEELKKRLMSQMAADRIMQYSVEWNPETGIDPEKDLRSGDYISRLCGEFHDRLWRDIEKAVKERENALHDREPLLQEVTQHTRFCREKLRCFYGRQDALKCARDYLKSNSRSVFVIHGQSGSGKTSIVAMAAREAWKIQRGKGAIILRFLGTTPDSTTISSLLSSIIRQLQAIKERKVALDDKDIPTKMAERTDMFHKLLQETGRANFLVTLLLDSLDQLDPSGGARQLTWLPKVLPPNVKMIVSTLPEEQYEAFPKLKARYESETSNFYEVPVLGDSDVSGILENWLSAADRQVTPAQMDILREACRRSPLPLFLKLSFDEACRWHSYWSVNDTQLQATVRESINVMFARVERLHGETLVKRALGYLTVSRGGLTETEMEDVLSCDDDVLNNVYVYWVPPVRRLPPLLLVRLKADLGEYLVDRGADGMQVFFWYHRQFIEAAHMRYCDGDNAETLHASLADFFAGTWATPENAVNRREKPYVTKTKQGIMEGKADRFVSLQPLMFGKGPNLRKLNNLPYHSIRAKKKDMLRDECLLNFAFLQAKLQASGIRSVLDDYTEARKVFPGDNDLDTVAEALQLSQVSLHHDPKRLPSQLLGRITCPKKSLEQFLEECRNCSHAYLLPNQQLLTPAGGQLLHSLAEHTRPVDALAMTSDGKFVITCSYFDSSLYIINVEEGKRVQKIEDVSTHEVFLCCDDSIIVTIPDNYIMAYKFSTVEFSTATRDWKVEVSAEPKLCFCGADRSVMAVFHQQEINLHNARTGDKTAVIDFEAPAYFQGFCYPTGSERFAAVLAMIRPMDMRSQGIIVRLNDRLQGAIITLEVNKKKVVASRLTRDLAQVKDGASNTVALTVKGLVMSGDGNCVVCATHNNDDLHFLDAGTLKSKKIYKANHPGLLGQFHVTPNGQHMYSSDGRAVWVLELQTERSASCLLQGACKLLDVVTADLHTFVTIAVEDPLVRIWDLNRGLPAGKTAALDFREAIIDVKEELEKLQKNGGKSSKQSTEGETDAEGRDARDRMTLPRALSTTRIMIKMKQAQTAKTVIGKVVSLQNSRYVLLLSTHGSDHFLQVFDVAAAKVVRRAYIGTTEPTEINHVVDTYVTARAVTRLKLIDVNKMAVVVRFQGHVLKDATDCICPIRDGKEIVTMTADGLHLKFYSVATGKVLQIVKQTSSQPYAMNKLMVNKRSSVAVGASAQGTFSVFNLLQMSHVYTIVTEGNWPESFGCPITADGRYLLYTREITLTKEDKREMWEGELLFVYDLHTRELKTPLVDTEWFLKPDREAYIFDWTMVDDSHVLALESGGLCTYDINTGELIRRVDTSDVGSVLKIFTDSDCPLLVTGGSSRFEESSLKVWRQSDLSLVAAFSSDTLLDGFMLLTSHGNQFLAVARDSFSDPVVFSLHGIGKDELLRNEKPLSQHPEVFNGQDLMLAIEDLDTDEGIDDDSDPDCDLTTASAGDVEGGNMASVHTPANSGYVTTSSYKLRWEAEGEAY